MLVWDTLPTLRGLSNLKKNKQFFSAPELNASLCLALGLMLHAYVSFMNRSTFETFLPCEIILLCTVALHVFLRVKLENKSLSQLCSRQQ